MSQSNRVEFAHNLRGLAALLVVVAHLGLLYWYWHSAVILYTGITPYAGTPPLISRLLNHVQLFNFGELGVSIFFLISGFVIPFALEKQTRLQFLIGRVFRIWPTYVAGLTVTLLSLAVASWYFAIPFVPTLHSIVASLLLSPSLLAQPSIDGIVWTLEIEIKFYALLVLFPALTRNNTLLLLAAIGLLLASFALKNHPVAANDYTYLIYMFVGVLFNQHYHNRINGGQFVGLSVMFLTLFFISTGWISSYVTGLAVFAVCYLFQQRLAFLSLFNRLANISYPLYCCHTILGYVVLSIFLSHYHRPTIALLLAVVLALVLATVIHKLIEVPTSEYGRQLGARLAARQFRCRSR